MVAADDHRTGSHKEQGFEESVSDQVESGCHVSANSQSCDHIAQLTDRRIRQHSFNVILSDGDDRCKYRCKRADKGDNTHGRVMMFQLDNNVQEREDPGNQENTGRNHCRSMDQRADRRRTFHCIRQPDMQWELSGFSDRTAKDQNSDS